MKALTVQQPWAWAIIHGGKDVENRTQAWSYRGPLAIHAGARWSQRGGHSGLVAEAYFDARHRQGWRVVNREDAVRNAVRNGLGRFPVDEQFGALIGIVDLVDVHPAQQSGFCCESDWAETEYRDRQSLVHLVLRNPRPLPQPVPCKGRLGLWNVPADIAAQVAP